MAHPLIDQLRFTRSEFLRGLGDVTSPEAEQRIGNMNSISWIVGHLAWQEQRYWLHRAQGKVLVPELNEMLASGKPACTPPIDEMWAAWRQVTQAADPWLDELTGDRLQSTMENWIATPGNLIQRVIYHYWYHLGEGMAIRQMLGHTDLADFVGSIDTLAPYRPESAAEARVPVHKDELIRSVRENWQRWEMLLDQVSDEQLVRPGMCGEWSIKDIIAHITWHVREMLGLLQSRVLAGSEMWMWPLDLRNQAIFEQHRDLPLEQVRAEATEAHRTLLEELEKLSEEDLHDPARFADMPADWRPWIILAENTYAHYHEHYMSLKEHLEKSAL